MAQPRYDALILQQQPQTDAMMQGMEFVKTEQTEESIQQKRMNDGGRISRGQMAGTVAAAGGLLGLALIAPVAAALVAGAAAVAAASHHNNNKTNENTVVVSDNSSNNENVDSGFVVVENCQEDLDKIPNQEFFESYSFKQPKAKPEQLGGAAAAGGILGLVLVGPLTAVAAAGAAAVAAVSKGNAGDVARAGGDVMVAARDRLKNIDKKHHVVRNTSKAFIEGCRWISTGLRSDPQTSQQNPGPAVSSGGVTAVVGGLVGIALVAPMVGAMAVGSAVVAGSAVLARRAVEDETDAGGAGPQDSATADHNPPKENWLAKFVGLFGKSKKQPLISADLIAAAPTEPTAEPIQEVIFADTGLGDADSSFFN